MSKPVYFHYEYPQLSDEWHAARRLRITASIAAGCLGQSRWLSPQKAYRIIVGAEVPATNWYMQHGRDMEPIAVEYYEWNHGVCCAESGLWVREDTPWLCASPDRLVGEDGLVEIKCSQKDHPECDLEWRIQASVQLHCTGRDWCDVAWFRDVIEGEWRIRPGEIPRLIERLDRFYETFVKPRREPQRGEVQSWE